MPSWIPLNLHSYYSILQSTLSISAIIARAKADGLPSIGLADEGNLFGAVDFIKEAKKEGIKPLVGITLMLSPGPRSEKKRAPGQPSGTPITLLAKNRAGYRSLCKLASFAYTEGFYYTPRIDRELLERYHEGLCCLSGNFRGSLGGYLLSGNQEGFEKELSFFHTLFGEDFYFEISRHHLLEEGELERAFPESWQLQLYKDSIEKERKINQLFVEIGRERKIPFVATHDIYFMERDEWKAQEILMNIQTGEPVVISERDSTGRVISSRPNPRREVRFTKEHRFPTQEEMQKRFADLPEALLESVKISEKLALELDFSARFYPVFVPPDLEGKEFDEASRKKAAEDFLTELCEKGIKERYTKERLAVLARLFKTDDPLKLIRERLSLELSVINPKGMCDYLLIVYDFIAWAKSRDIPVGPGRGSGAGSIVLFLIGITDIEPLRFHLFFERFINPERLSYPDIDVDICMERRGEVINYMLSRYGHDRVAQIITFGTMKAKMAIKDVGRILDIPLAKVTRVAALVPDDLSMTLAEALKIDADLANLVQEDQEVKELYAIAQKLEGQIRNTGIHAAGLIVCADPLTDHIPVCLPKETEMVATQYSMKPVESVGMLKIDFLGLKTLTSIQKCVRMIEKGRKIRLQWNDLPLDDTPTYDLLNQGKTSGIFQLESSGMQDLAHKLHIDCFEEIIAVGALYRPGPMDMIPSFIARKHGKEAIEYEHPLLEEILKETYGIMVYQEQVMQIAQKLAGYSLGEGDVLRRAMGKKDHKEMGRQKEKFLEGAKKSGILPEVAASIFDKMEKFASYGFNKSHAAAYGYLSYVTAYMKANYPAEWMSALMSCDHSDVEKVAKHIRECQAMQIAVAPPDINRSIDTFFPSDGSIRFGLAAIKGVGESIVALILDEREKKGPYTSLSNFLERLPIRKIGKKSIELLIDVGAFDEFAPSNSRLAVKGQLEKLFPTFLERQKDIEKGYMDLFGHLPEPVLKDEAAVEIPQDSPLERLQREKELLGFYLSGHPLDSFKEQLLAFGFEKFSAFREKNDLIVAPIAVTTEVVSIKVSSKNQKKFAALFVSDGVETCEIPLWSELFESLESPPVENQLYAFLIQCDRSQEPYRLNCRKVLPLKKITEAVIAEWKQEATFLSRPMRKKIQAEAQVAPPLELRLDLSQFSMKQVALMRALFRKFPGNSPCHLQFWRRDKKVGSITIDARRGVDKKPALLAELESIVGLSLC